MVFLWFSYGFPMVFLWFSLVGCTWMQPKVISLWASAAACFSPTSLRSPEYKMTCHIVSQGYFFTSLQGFIHYYIPSPTETDKNNMFKENPMFWGQTRCFHFSSISGFPRMSPQPFSSTLVVPHSTSMILGFNPEGEHGWTVQTNWSSRTCFMVKKYIPHITHQCEPNIAA